MNSSSYCRDTACASVGSQELLSGHALTAEAGRSRRYGRGRTGFCMDAGVRIVSYAQGQADMQLWGCVQMMIRSSSLSSLFWGGGFAFVSFFLSRLSVYLPRFISVSVAASALYASNRSVDRLFGLEESSLGIEFLVRRLAMSDAGRMQAAAEALSLVALLGKKTMPPPSRDKKDQRVRALLTAGRRGKKARGRGRRMHRKSPVLTMADVWRSRGRWTAKKKVPAQ